MYKAKKNWVVKSLLFSTILGSSLLVSNNQTFADEVDGQWIARTSDQIKAEISGNEYLIKWGDTLSAISEATNISVNRLAEINQISNVDLIYAGNKLVFGGEIDATTGEDNRLVAVQGQDGKTKVVINTDENKPVVNQNETNKAKETENSGGTYTPPTNTGNTNKPSLPTVPETPAQPEVPTPEQPVQPENPVQPEQPKPEQPVDPETPEPSEADKTALTNLYNSVTNLVSTDYTVDSWNQFKTVRSEAQAVLNNTDATQAEVDTMVVKLQNAISSLVAAESPIQVDKSALTSLYNSVTDLVSTDYTTESWAAFRSVREQAQLIIQNANATQTQVDSMTVALQQAINNLVRAEQPIQVDKSGLQALVNNVRDYQAEDYTAESWDSFYQAFSEAVAVLADANATQQQVDQALATLQTTVDALIAETPAPEVNKQALTDLYNSTANFASSDYTESTWNNFIQVKAAAKEVLDNPAATQAEVDAKTTELQNAINSLVEVETPVIVDKAALLALYESTTNYDAADYTQESWNIFIQAKASAKQVIDNQNVTQEEVANATTALQTAIDNLVEAEQPIVVDKSALISLYDSTATFDSNTYTEISWNLFIQAKAAAKQVIDNVNATQSDITSAIQALQNGINQLMEKPIPGSDLSNLAEKAPTYSASMSTKFEEAVNNYRSSQGVFTLPISSASQEIAKSEAAANTSTNYLDWRAQHGHSGISVMFTIIGSANEDQAVAEAMSRFKASPGHNANLLEDDPFFVDNFGGGVYVMKTTIDSTIIYSFVFNGWFGL